MTRNDTRVVRIGDRVIGGGTDPVHVQYKNRGCGGYSGSDP